MNYLLNIVNIFLIFIFIFLIFKPKKTLYAISVFLLTLALQILLINSKIDILGLTFKENCPDTRNSKVDDIIKRFNEYGIEPVVVDPWANEGDAMHEYGVRLTALEDVNEADCVIVAVAHDEFRKISLEEIKKMYKKDISDSESVIIDVKGIYKVEDLKKSGLRYWRL